MLEVLIAAAEAERAGLSFKYRVKNISNFSLIKSGYFGREICCSHLIAETYTWEMKENRK